MQASIVIPTFNRPNSLQRTLRSLEGQDGLVGEYEVIVVDDGSAKATESVSFNGFGYPIRYVKGPHRGATHSRNQGAKIGNGEVLVFVDDDVTLSTSALRELTATCMAAPNRVAIGNLEDRSPEPNSVFARVMLGQRAGVQQIQDDELIPFVECNTQLLAVRKSDFFDLGMLTDPTGGWPNWDDVDFGYRAHHAGFQIIKCACAIGTHWDCALSDLESASDRWYRAAFSAPKLFQVHPELFRYIKMFDDKSPQSWRDDSPSLLLRKFGRSISALGPCRRTMEILVSMLEGYLPNPQLLDPLYRWIIGGQIYLGYRDGIRERLDARNPIGLKA